MEAPEDQSRKRDFLILLITVPVVTDPSLTTGKGQMKHDFEVLSNYYFLDDMISKGRIEATVVIASNENHPLSVTSQPRSTIPKLLLLRIHSLIKSSVTDQVVEDIYEMCGAVAGKRGFDLTRTGGSSGKTNDQTDVEFLHAMHEVGSALPRKLGA